MGNVGLYALVVFWPALGVPRASSGDTIQVPDDHTTIQAAIDAATDGDEIVVAPGTYPEAINFLGKPITLRSSNGPEVTTIDGTGLTDSVVRCTLSEGPDTVFEGFTVTGGSVRGMYNSRSSATIINCLFLGNHGSVGAGMYNSTSNPTVIRCTFRDNHATDGGGMYNFFSAPSLINCTFEGNTANYGAAMYNSSSSPTVMNCTFSGNSAVVRGGGMYGFSVPRVVTNCIFWRNAPDELDGSGALTVAFSNVQGGLPAWVVDGGGNIDVDPMFVRNPRTLGIADHGDLRLRGGSTCIDAGNNGAVPPNVEVDRVGASRFVDGACEADTGLGQAPHIDMGAFEFQPSKDCGDAVCGKGESCESCPCDCGDCCGNGICDDFENCRTCPQECACPTLHVPADHITIQAAIDAAPDGAEVIVAPGAYNETIRLWGKLITVRSSDGAGTSIIDGTGLGTNVVRFIDHETPDTVFEGFTITGGTGTSCPTPRHYDTCGGGMYLYGSSPTIRDCTVVANACDFHGGGIFCRNGGPVIENCHFENNIGGGIYNYFSSGIVTGCSFVRNPGTGLYSENSNPLVLNSAFLGNQIVGLYDRDGTGSTVVNCTFVGNRHGGLTIFGGGATVSNCTLIGNRGSFYGGGIYFLNTESSASNCIVRDNWPRDIDAENSLATVAFSNFRSGSAQDIIDGGGNIDRKPTFGRPPSDGSDGFADDPDTPDVDESANDDYGDVHLLRGSHGVDAGNSAAVPDNVETDADGSPRFVDDPCVADTGLGEDAVVDMGAFEYQSPGLPCPTFQVPGDYATIQAAIDAAANGDEVIVAPGTYHEIIDLLGKEITVRSTGGPDVTIIDGTGLNNSVVTCNNNEGPETILEGFTVTGGTGKPDVGGQLMRGGGMYIVSDPTVRRCVFAANTAHWGGGVYAAYRQPVFTDCVFRENRADKEGGGALGNGTFTGCTFLRNTAGDRGGGIQAGSATFANCMFVANAANNLGGGLNNYGLFAVGWFTMTGSHFWGNSARQGGGMYSWGSPTLKSCSFSKNVATEGAAIYTLGGRLTLTNCTLPWNTAARGSAIYNENNDVTLNSCVVWGNLPIDDQFRNTSGGTIDISHSCVQGGWQGIGNIQVDPMLSADGAHLLAGSPCIDAGDAEVDSAGQSDIDGEPRVSGGRVDMGADEWSDADWDGLPDWWELRYFGSTVDAEPEHDAEPDGLPNSGEYVAGRNPVCEPNAIFVSAAGNDAWDGLAAAWDGEHGPKATIQSAISIADRFERDEIVLADGIYTGPGNLNIDTRGKRLTVRSANGPQNCVIDGGGKARAFFFHFGETKETIIHGLTIRNGRDSSGGAVLFSRSSPTLAQCTLTRNAASGDGGAIYSYKSHPHVVGCTFNGNTALASRAEGGAMYNNEGGPTVDRCTFAGNRAYSGGAVSNFRSELVVSNTTFSGNRATYGAGISAIGGSSVTLTNNTFAANRSITVGGGMYIYQSTSTIDNCIFWNDRPWELQVANETTVTIGHSNIEDGVPDQASDAGGNIDIEPMFVRPPNGGSDGFSDDPSTPDVDESENDDYGDLALQYGSPCIDAGDNDALPAGVQTDHAGAARIADDTCTEDTGLGQAPIVDMGAFEFPSPDPPCETYYVPGDFETIQAAIDAGRSGDTVVVGPGTYNEAIDYLGKAITLQSSDGAQVTILDGTGLDDTVIKCINGEGREAELRGFTIYGGTGMPISVDAAGPPGTSGGGMFIRDASPTIIDCVFTGNSVTQNGGGIFSDSAEPMLLRCSFNGNTAGFGGGMAVIDGNPVIINSTFAANRALNPATGGNTGYGGALYAYSAYVYVPSCTFVANYAARGGGGLYGDASQIEARSTIIWGNRPTQFEGYYDVVMGHCNIQGGLDHYMDDRGGNIEADPLFLREPFTNGPDDFGDLRLRGGSPCIDAGDDRWLPKGVDTDRDGAPRVTDAPCEANTGIGPLPVMDIGAYEFQPPPTCGDVVCDEGEDCASCPCDCGGCCGNEICELFESCMSCANDCTCETIHVPADHASIQSAIYVARDGDGIIVAPGTYNEIIDFSGKAVHLRSSGGPNVTIIDGTGFNDNVVTCAGYENQNTILRGFTVTGGRRGMFNLRTNPTVVDCIFVGHSVGGMLNEEASTAVTNCVFIGNDGFGMYNDRGEPSVTNCTFSGNLNWGMYNFYSTCTITNSILWRNIPGEIVVSGTSTFTVGSSIIKGGLPPGAADTGGNIDADPMFMRDPYFGLGGWDGIDDVYGDLRLRSGSPAIDAGDNGAVPPAVHTDPDGGARYVDDPCTVDSGAGDAPIVDIGAYEFAVGGTCGDGVCDPAESCFSCPCDCGPCCGNDVCEDFETCVSCTQDCPCRSLFVPSEYATIQEAINEALDGEEVVVASGTYNESINLLRKPITVRSQNGAAVTTIDATGLNDSAINCVSGEGPDTIIMGFTISGGAHRSCVNRPLGICGGGMAIEFSGPTVTQCIFKNNQSSGLYNWESGPTVTDCTFTMNETVYGAGMLNVNSYPIVERCTFIANRATWGGAMFSYAGAPHVRDCKFARNRAGSGGAVNNGFGDFGASFIGCVFHANTASVGGAMSNDSGSPLISDCTFVGNTAVANGGLVASNRPGQGGAIYNFSYSTPTINNCTFIKNIAVDGGAMFSGYASDPLVTNSIFWGDAPNEITNEQYDSASLIGYSNIRGAWPAWAIDDGGNISADPMFMRLPDDGGDGWPDDPDTPAVNEADNNDYGDLRLRSGSPSIDAAKNNAVPEEIEVDLQGEPRFTDDSCTLDTGVGDAPIVDMGAYEFQPHPDCGNGDCDPDESCATCACDCSPCCGNELCEVFESCVTCANDCACQSLYVPADYLTIQAAIDAAADGATIIVAPGTYNETINFLGKPLVLRSDSGPEVTIVDGAGLDDSVVKCASGEGPETVFQGFTVTGGTGSGAGACSFSSSGGPCGGGMFNQYSSPTVADCIFRVNTAAEGAGMYNGTDSEPTVSDCRFVENHATQRGGGMHNHESGNPIVLSCMFERNTAQDDGGGLYNFASSPTVSHSSFVANVARRGGAVSNYQATHATVCDCTFLGNRASLLGGAMHNDYNSSVTVDKCAFLGNSSDDRGGGMSNYTNQTDVRNCVFSGNRAALGGGMYNFYSPTVTNCTFSANLALTSGGAMHNYLGDPTLLNCILWGDLPDEIGEDNSTPEIAFSNIQGGLTPGAIDNGGNIHTDPLFVRAPGDGGDGFGDDPETTEVDEGDNDDYGDLRLQVASPSINAGDPAYDAAPGQTDLNGHPRVLCAQIDMGAHEHGIGDFDCNGVVDLSDLSQWAACTTGPSPTPMDLGPGYPLAECAAFDINGDLNIDLWDFAALQNLITQAP